MRRTQEGFTLVEIVVVIAILGVLAAVVIPSIRSYLSESKQQAYEVNLKRIQLAVSAYYSAPANSRYLGMRQYPLLGQGKTADDFHQNDANTNVETIVIAGNPVRATTGGSPKWVDGDDGVRDDDEEHLNDEDATSVTPGWRVANVLRGGVGYLVDSRDYFINFEILVAEDLLDRVPESASLDNKPPDSALAYDGSYSWYVDDKGRVQSLYHFFPQSDQTGFREAYP